MDGKTGAEHLIAQAINDPTLLQALVGAPKPSEPTGTTGSESTGNEG
jgi:type VI secretion system protein ImpB